MKEETWKTIEDASRYLVSNLGRVYSNISGIVLRTYVNNSGYECVDLSGDNQKVLKRTMHRLVAKAFCGNYQEGKIVNHINSNRLDNRANNLEWLTYIESIEEMKARGVLNTHKAREALKKVVHKKVDQYTKDGQTYLKTYDSVKEAGIAVTGRKAPHISTVINGRRQTAYGYHWKLHNPNEK